MPGILSAKVHGAAVTVRPFRRQLMVNTVASGLANVWAMVAALATVPLLVAGLGRESFGVWALVMTFSATNGWLSLGDLGIVVAATRDISGHLAVDDRRAASVVVSNALACAVVLGLVGGALLALAGTVLPHVFDTPDRLVGPFRVALALMGLQVVLDLTINVAEGALEGAQRVDLSRAVDAFRRFAFVAGTAVGALVGEDVRWVAVGSVVTTAVGLVVAIVVLRRHLPGFAVRPEPSAMRELVRSGREVAVLRPLGVIQRTMDRMLVGVVLGPGAVALVEVAMQVQAGAEAILSASSYSVMPTASWLTARGDRSTIARLASRATKFSLLATLPVAVASGTLAAPFVELWLGGRFGDAAGLIAVAACAVALNAPFAVGSQILIGRGRTTAVLRAALVAVSVNLVVSTILLHVVGVVGVFLGTLVGNVVIAVVLQPSILDATGLRANEFWSDAVRPSIAPVLAQLVTALLLLRIDLEPLPSLLLVGGASTAVYVAVALRFSVTRAELRELGGRAST